MVRWCVLALAGVAFAQQPQPPGRGVNFYSCEKEAALGAQVAADFARDTTPLTSAAVRDFVERIGGTIAAQMPADCPGNPYRYTVVADDTLFHEPVALPGGYIFIPSGLLLASHSEAEFAGILAHAMAHVAERHGTRSASRAEIVNMASVPLVFVGGWAGYAMRQGAGAALPISFLAFQRQNELAADRDAVKTMAATGYDPEALVRYVAREQSDGGPAAFAPFPKRDLRIDALLATIATLPPAPYNTEDGLTPIQDEVRRLTQGIPPSLRQPPSLIHH